MVAHVEPSSAEAVFERLVAEPDDAGSPRLTAD